VAAHALNLGLDWREVLEIDRGELDQLVESAIWQRAADLKHEEQRAFARMIAAELAPAFGGTRRMQSSTSTRHG
jgi:predicted butyrate kinase (DUF1464 family)